MVIELGKVEDLNSIVYMIKTSPLGDVYFVDKNLHKIVIDGILNKEVHVLLDGGIIHGFMWSNKAGAFGKYPYLHMLIIDQNQRSKGFGSSLLTYFENVLYKDYNKVFLMVGDFNTRAKGLYERLGYREVAFFPRFYCDHVNEYLLMKETIKV